MTFFKHFFFTTIIMKCKKKKPVQFWKQIYLLILNHKLVFWRTASHYEICTALALSPVHNIRLFTTIQKNKVSFSWFIKEIKNNDVYTKLHEVIQQFYRMKCNADRNMIYGWKCKLLSQFSLTESMQQHYNA